MLAESINKLSLVVRIFTLWSKVAAYLLTFSQDFIWKVVGMPGRRMPQKATQCNRRIRTAASLQQKFCDRVPTMSRNRSTLLSQCYEYFIAKLKLKCLK